MTELFDYNVEFPGTVRAANYVDALTIVESIVRDSTQSLSQTFKISKDPTIKDKITKIMNSLVDDRMNVDLYILCECLLGQRETYVINTENGPIPITV